MGFFDRFFKKKELDLRPMRFAGMLYPEDPEELVARVASYLDSSAGEAAEPAHPAARALIVPQAEYDFAGATMGAAYGRVRASVRAGHAIDRVVLVGSSRLVPFRGVAVTGFDGFETSLGPAVIDTDCVQQLVGAGRVRPLEPAFDPEASLEVQLPFLEAALDAFELVPLLVGDATGEEVGELLAPFVAEPATLVVVSANMSHDKSAERAAALDDELRRAVEALDPDAIGREHTDARVAIRGLLRAASSRGLRARLLDRRTSAEAAATGESVTGYGAFVFEGSP